MLWKKLHLDLTWQDNWVCHESDVALTSITFWPPALILLLCLCPLPLPLIHHSFCGSNIKEKPLPVFHLKIKCEKIKQVNPRLSIYPANNRHHLWNAYCVPILFSKNNLKLIRNLQGKGHYPSVLADILLFANDKSYSNKVKQETSLERQWVSHRI